MDVDIVSGGLGWLRRGGITSLEKTASAWDAVRSIGGHAALGAATGAASGAAFSDSGQRGSGALKGAVIGGTLGAAGATAGRAMQRAGNRGVFEQAKEVTRAAEAAKAIHGYHPTTAKGIVGDPHIDHYNKQHALLGEQMKRVERGNDMMRVAKGSGLGGVFGARQAPDQSQQPIPQKIAASRVGEVLGAAGKGMAIGGTWGGIRGAMDQDASPEVIAKSALRGAATGGILHGVGQTIRTPASMRNPKVIEHTEPLRDSIGGVLQDATRYGVPFIVAGRGLVRDRREARKAKELAARSEPEKVGDAGDRKGFNWHAAAEGLRDEGIPMAGMVAGAYLGGKLLPGGEIAGSGVGYASGALGNLALEHALAKRRAAAALAAASTPKAASGNWKEFIPAAIGATLGAALGGGMSKDEKSQGRNMLAGSAIGYGVGDLGLLAAKALKGKK